MLFIGITGGVGAGKSAVLEYLSRRTDTRVMLADEIAHELMEPGTDCYRELRRAIGDETLYAADGHFCKEKLAAWLFGSEANRQLLNGIVHPAVKDYVRRTAAEEEKKGKLALLVLEAALLIEEHYDEVCQELWYIYTSEDNRRKRLKETRGYTDAKITAIFRSQLPEEVFRSRCTETIDNNGSREETQEQIRQLLLARGM